MFNCPPSNTCMCKCVEWFCNEKIVSFCTGLQNPKGYLYFLLYGKNRENQKPWMHVFKDFTENCNKKIICLLLNTILSKDCISNVPINKILLRKAYCNNKRCLWYWIQWLCGSHRYDTNLVHVFVENKAAILGKFMPLPTLLCTVIYKSFCHLQCPWKQLFQ